MGDLDKSRQGVFHKIESLYGADDGYHYVEGVVYSPLQVDTDWDSMTAIDVKRMAHDFLSSGLVDEIDVMHDQSKSGAEVVESFIARKGDDYPEGAWILGVRLKDGPLWEKINKGELNGFSVEVNAYKVPKLVAVDVVRFATGTTEPGGDPSHTHVYFIEFVEDGKVTAGTTTKESKHIHKISGTTATDSANGHSHRFEVG